MTEVTKPVAKYLKDYLKPDYLIESLDLVFELADEQTTVAAAIKVKRNGRHNKPLVLMGKELTLNQISIDGQTPDAANYVADETSLTINEVPQQFILFTQVSIDPVNNTSLEGLYKADGAFCTQCEAEGFRRITYFLDRPDVLCKYSSKIIADKANYPYLLSNGNKIGSGELDDGKHWVQWQDPFNKPSYLFALVAGKFDCLSDSYTTLSGRQVKLELYVDSGNKDKAPHAMASLKKSMKWDEDTFGLEYDLDIYMIVAVDFFNMGAMENKGLNVFNSKFVLASSATATDLDYHNIESVIGHEYFHNWTGNRVTCRDWFQLSLKEGLTVFRDQQFSIDMGSEVVNRIAAVKVMRTQQFAEDAGPMSHPIRPEKVIEMNNFYTVTVYDKGAEVIRMMHSLLGAELFRKGLALYIARHDGCAVTCDDFVAAMETAGGIDLTQFRRWYSQSGTPELKIEGEFDPRQQTYTLNIEQINRPTTDQADKQPLHIPFAIELLDAQGSSVPLIVNGKKVGAVLDVRDAHNRFVFEQVSEAPVPVLLQNFSAPVKIDYDASEDALLHIVNHASSDFSRWDAAQTLYLNKVHQFIASPTDFELGGKFIGVFADLLNDASVDKALIAEILTVPSFSTIAGNFDIIPVDGINQALEAIKSALANALYAQLMACYQTNMASDYQQSQQAIAKRALKNACLQLLACQATVAVNELLAVQFEQSDNMTDSLAVLSACNGAGHQGFFNYMSAFEQQWHDDMLVMDKWFALHAGWAKSDVFDTIETLYRHPAFNIENPNRVRAVIGSFAALNAVQFHAISGQGYRALTDVLIKLDKINPQTASRLLTPLMSLKRYDKVRQQLMREQLQRLAALPALSPDVYEKVVQGLKA